MSFANSATQMHFDANSTEHQHANTTRKNIFALYSAGSYLYKHSYEKYIIDPNLINETNWESMKLGVTHIHLLLYIFNTETPITQEILEKIYPDILTTCPKFYIHQPVDNFKGIKMLPAVDEVVTFCQQQITAASSRNAATPWTSLKFSPGLTFTQFAEIVKNAVPATTVPKPDVTRARDLKDINEIEGIKNYSVEKASSTPESLIAGFRLLPRRSGYMCDEPNVNAAQMADITLPCYQTRINGEVRNRALNIENYLEDSKALIQATRDRDSNISFGDQAAVIGDCGPFRSKVGTNVEYTIPMTSMEINTKMALALPVAMDPDKSVEDVEDIMGIDLPAAYRTVEKKRYAFTDVSWFKKQAPKATIAGWDYDDTTLGRYLPVVTNVEQLKKLYIHVVVALSGTVNLNLVFTSVDALIVGGGTNFKDLLDRFVTIAPLLVGIGNVTSSMSDRSILGVSDFSTKLKLVVRTANTVYSSSLQENIAYSLARFPENISDLRAVMMVVATICQCAKGRPITKQILNINLLAARIPNLEKIKKAWIDHFAAFNNQQNAAMKGRNDRKINSLLKFLQDETCSATERMKSLYPYVAFANSASYTYTAEGVTADNVKALSAYLDE